MKPIRPFFRALLAVSILLVGTEGVSAQGSGKISLIRDAEIENTIRYYARPLFNAAGLDIESVRVHLVLDDRMNAFVAGGQRIFIHTGLLRNAAGPNAVIGVLAHETGHISAGHLLQINDRLRSASAQAIIAMVLGAAAAVATGDPQAAVGTTLLGQSVAERSFLRYSQSMESAADQAALRYLDATGQSAEGLLQILTKLQDQELIAGGGGDPYLRTHPLSQDRIATVRRHLEVSPYSNVPVDGNLEIWHRRMRGKLNGYIDPPAKTLARYREDSKDVEALYARIFAFKKLHRTDEALAIVNRLIELSPNDPFFQETKGDVLRDAGRIKEALAPYRRSVELVPDSALLRLNLAQALLEIDDPALAREAIEHLNQATHQEPWIPRAWRLKATAHGRLGDMGGVALALAEEALLLRDIESAKLHSKRALDLIPADKENRARRLQAMDIQNRIAGGGNSTPAE